MSPRPLNSPWTGVFLYASSPRPVIIGRSSALSRPGFAAQTAGIAFTSRVAVRAIEYGQLADEILRRGLKSKVDAVPSDTGATHEGE